MRRSWHRSPVDFIEVVARLPLLTVSGGRRRYPLGQRICPCLVALRSGGKRQDRESPQTGKAPEPCSVWDGSQKHTAHRVLRPPERIATSERRRGKRIRRVYLVDSCERCAHLVGRAYEQGLIWGRLDENLASGDRPADWRPVSRCSRPYHSPTSAGRRKSLPLDYVLDH